VKENNEKKAVNQRHQPAKYLKMAKIINMHQQQWQESET